MVIQMVSFSSFSKMVHRVNGILLFMYIKMPPPLFSCLSFLIVSYPFMFIASFGISVVSHVSVIIAISISLFKISDSRSFVLFRIDRAFVKYILGISYCFLVVSLFELLFVLAVFCCGCQILKPVTATGFTSRLFL